MTLWSDRALALGSRSTGLGKDGQEPRARFHVAGMESVLSYEEATKQPAPSQARFV